MPSQVIPARYWLNTKTGRTASLSGAVPYVNSPLEEGWVIKEAGFTLRHADGTTGLGRVPFTTEAEAQAWADAHPTFKGMSR